MDTIKQFIDPYSKKFIITTLFIYPLVLSIFLSGSSNMGAFIVGFVLWLGMVALCVRGFIARRKGTVKDSVLTPSFTATKKVGNLIAVDDSSGKWKVLAKTSGRGKVRLYSDILSFELLDDGESVTEGGIGKALAGGLMFGGVGAIVGGVTASRSTKSICNSMQIKVVLNDMNTPSLYIPVIKSKTRRDTSDYQKRFRLAQECLSLLQIMCDRANANKQVNSPQ